MARPENDRGWSPSSPNSSQLIYWEAYRSSLSGLGTASCVGLGSTFANSRNDGIRSSARVKSPVPSLPLPDLLLLPSVVTKKMGPIKTEREASSQRYLESTSTHWVCQKMVLTKAQRWKLGAEVLRWGHFCKSDCEPMKKQANSHCLLNLRNQMQLDCGHLVWTEHHLLIHHWCII